MSPPSPTPDQPPPGRSRARWVGVAVGVVVPLVAFLGLVVLGDPAWWIGQLTWSAVAFVGVVLLLSPRTKQFGAGMLLGFAVLFLVGAGVCTAAVVTVA